MQEHYCKSLDVSVFANVGRMDDDISSDRDLITRLGLWSGLKPTQIARRAGLTPTTLTRVLNKPVNHSLSMPTLRKLRAAFPEYPGFGAASDLPSELNDRDYVRVVVMPSFAGMGGGGNGEGEPGSAMVPRRLIEDELRGRSQDFELIDVRGDSMMPDFHHGDQILIDRRDRDPRQPGPFALWDGDGYVVKLVERVPNRRGWYRIFSANDRYSSYEIEETEMTIRGRPVWFARRL